ncbi:cubilin-like [Clavelina lepadiformis]|uniref:cubilin-like n=1 Tax=Clavelina lepadiformis TaxID=159417 RepID=UPI004041E2D7
MLLKVTLVLFLAWKLDAAISSSADDVYAIGLFPEPVYEAGQLSDDPLSALDQQSLQVKVSNPGFAAEDIGFHAYLPKNAEMSSFSMHTEGVRYNAKKGSREMAHEVLKKAKAEDHNAAIYIPKPLLDAYDKEIQSAENTVHIKAGNEMIFNIQYKESLAELIANGEKPLNRARVSLDLYGVQVEDLNAEISSPNYPNDYPNNADTTWWVRAPEDKTVSFRLFDIDMEECCDRLTIYDGLSIHDDILGEITGSSSSINSTSPIKTYQSSTNSMFLRLASDCTSTARGFRALMRATAPSPSSTKEPETTTPHRTTIPSYERTTVPSYERTTYPVSTCSGTTELYAHTHAHTFSSPGYPNGYSNNLDCSWRIYSSSSGYVVKLDVLDMNIEENYDVVYVYDGYSSSFPRLASLTGNGTNQIFHSTGSYMFIDFRTDSSVTGLGFQFQYIESYTSAVTTAYPEITTVSNNYQNISACMGGDHIELYSYSSGFIISPNYPNYYASNAHCTWLIHGQSYDYIVLLTVTDLALSSNDKVTVYDGTSQYYPIIANFTSYSWTGQVLSTGSSMYIEFESDNYYENRGFNMTYSAYYTYCSSTQYISTYPSSNYTLYSPGYPNSYYDNLGCTWQVRSIYYGYVIKLTVVDMQLEPCCDYVYLYDGSTASSALLATLGNQQSGTFYSTGSYMYVKFQTDGSVTYKGFQFVVTAASPPATTVAYPDFTTNVISQPSACTGGDHIDLYSGSGSIYSPGYPSNYYSNAHCSWYIHGHYSYYVVKLSIYDLYLSYGDYLEVYDGSSQNSPLLQNITSNYYGNPIYSNGLSMYLVFSSDNYYESRGFQLYYEASYSSATTAQAPSFTEATTGTAIDQSNCTSVYYIYESNNPSGGNITSPNYPYNYPNNLDICWFFMLEPSPSHGHLYLTFDDFNTESGDDVLYVFSDYYNLIYSYSGFYSGGYYVNLWTYQSPYIRFRTNEWNNNRGFKITYSYGHH